MVGLIAILGALFFEALTQRTAQTISQIAVSPNGNLIAALGDRDTSVFNAETGKHIRSLPRIRAFNQQVDAIQFVDNDTLVMVFPESDELVSGIHWYSMSKATFTRELKMDRSGHQVALLKDKLLVQVFATQPSKHQFQFFGIEPNADSKPISTYVSPHCSYPFHSSSDGLRVAFFLSTHSNDLKPDLDFLRREKLVAPYDLTAQKYIQKLDHGTAIRFSPDDQHVAVANEKLNLYDWSTSKILWDRDYSFCQALRFSPDGQFIVALNRYPTSIALVDSRTGEDIQSLRTDTLNGTGFCFSPDSKKVWLPTDGLGLQTWNIETRKFEGPIGGDKRFERELTFFLLLSGWTILWFLAGSKSSTAPTDQTTPTADSLISQVAYFSFIALGGFYGISYLVTACFERLPLHLHEYGNAALPDISFHCGLLLFFFFLMFRVATVGLNRDWQRKNSAYYMQLAFVFGGDVINPILGLVGLLVSFVGKQLNSGRP